MRVSGTTLEIKMMRNHKTQRLARLYERELSQVTTLKKLLLHQAFTGEL